MTETSTRSLGQPDLDRARAGDRSAFDRLVGPLRAELHAHCYRMLGSTHDADDALQDALLRAWRGLDRFEGGASLRSWLYTVVTRSCLTAVRQKGRRALPMDLGPASERTVSDDVPRTAEVMGTSVASVNSALQRARKIVAHKVPDRTQQRTARDIGDSRLTEIVAGYASALERGDADALLALLTEDVTWSMPPLAHWYRGLDAVTRFAVEVPLTGCGHWRHRPVTANGQPALGCYLRKAGDGPFRAWSITVLTLRGDRIAEITTFIGEEQFAAFGLPLTVD